MLLLPAAVRLELGGNAAQNQDKSIGGPAAGDEGLHVLVDRKGLHDQN